MVEESESNIKHRISKLKINKRIKNYLTNLKALFRREPEPFPKPLQLAINALDDPIRQKIIMYLWANDWNQASFTEIKKVLNLRSNKLTYHLRKLVMGNILEKFYSEGHKKYIVTDFGIKLIENMFLSLTTFPQPIRPNRHKITKATYNVRFDYYNPPSSESVPIIIRRAKTHRLTSKSKRRHRATDDLPYLDYYLPMEQVIINE